MDSVYAAKNANTGIIIRFSMPWFKPFARWFDRPYYWQLNRERAASAVAVGMFCGLMPGPTQMLTALIVAYVVHT